MLTSALLNEAVDFKITNVVNIIPLAKKGLINVRKSEIIFVCNTTIVNTKTGVKKLIRVENR